MAKKKYIECGKFINTHGVGGALKVESWCNTPEELLDLERIFLPDLSGDMRERKILRSSVLGRFVLIWLEGMASIDDALPLKNKVLFALREDFNLEDGEFFIADLIGLVVMDHKSGKVYGEIADVINRGASDIYVVKTESGESMIPAVPEFIAEIDMEKGVFVTPIDGMF